MYMLVKTYGGIVTDMNCEREDHVKSGVDQTTEFGDRVILPDDGAGFMKTLIDSAKQVERNLDGDKKQSPKEKDNLHLDDKEQVTVYVTPVPYFPLSVEKGTLAVGCASVGFSVGSRFGKFFGVCGMVFGGAVGVLWENASTTEINVKDISRYLK